MEPLLKKLGLQSMLDKFQQERVVPAAVLLMNDEELQRLGIFAIGDRVRLRGLCKEFEEGTNATSSGTSSNVGETSTTRRGTLAQSIMDERMRLFNPRGSRSQSKKKSTPRPRTWTAQFFCLADKYQTKIPTSTEKQTLHKAGLGVKKIKLEIDDNEASVHQKLISSEKNEAGDVLGFPQLAEAGGFEMLHCLPNCRDLSSLQCSWAAREIRSNLGGQSKIYLRPIQKDLSTKSLIPKNSCELKEKCMGCNKEFSMSDLRVHSYLCTATVNSSDSGEEMKEEVIPNTSDSNVESVTVNQITEASIGHDVQIIQEVDPRSHFETTVTSEVICVPDDHDVNQDPTDVVVHKVVYYCKSNNIQNPVEILRCLQKEFVTGRKLDVEYTNQIVEGETNYINVDRNNLLETGFDEVRSLLNLRLTLEVSFYGEVAQDYGGPRREFFRLVLCAIKEKYFDNGIRDLLAEDYYVIGVIMGLSIIQNGKIPQFFSEDQLDGIFQNKSSSLALANLRKGLAKLCIYQVCNEIPILIHIFRPSPAASLTIKKLTNLLKPVFAEDGSNNRQFESSIYGAFCRYLREVASGRRNGVTLAHILWFCTGSDDEPLLGFSLHPSLLFTEGVNSFLPMANTCTNAISLPRPSSTKPQPPDES